MLLCVVAREFQSTPSGGKATSALLLAALDRKEFQSTPAGGKATNSVTQQDTENRVSIHAFRGEGDLPDNQNVINLLLFQSTPSGGKATIVERQRCVPLVLFQSTPSGGKATQMG